LKLFVNNIQAGASAANIPAGGMAEASFDLAGGLSGLNAAKISFNDFPVGFDNEFFMALNFTEKICVVEIKSNAGITPIEKVYGNAQVFSYHGAAVSNFNYNELAQADLVIVNGLNVLDPSLANALREYRNGGGALMIIPGAQPQAEAWKNVLQLPV